LLSNASDCPDFETATWKTGINGGSSFMIYIDMIHTIGYTFSSRIGIKMANIKTAISIEKPLFEEIEALAEEMKVSRSRLFTLATRDFIQHHKSQKLLDAINAAYNDLPDAEEKRLAAQMKSKHRRIVKGQW
jgi:hypothetical protein